MSVDCNDIFGNVKETFNNFGTFHFTPNVDDYEIHEETESIGPIIISDTEEKNKKKPKPKRTQKKKRDGDYEPNVTIKVNNNSKKRRCSKRLNEPTESENDCIIVDISTPPRVTKGRGSARQRGRGRAPRRGRSPRRGRPRTNNSIVTYNIGNTLDYTDDSENVPIFNTQQNDIIELDDGVDIENEEMAITIEWQSVEIIKFTIRRFQNLKPIYDFFCNKYNVEQENLLFMYEDKILQPDDTPDSISYQEAKLIDGGIVYKNKIKLTNNKDNNEKVESGIQIKFQYKNSKHPLVVYVENNAKLSLAMTKCAEKLEVPLNKLKFEFDGDIVSGKQTPNDLGLEGGECIDVKIIQ